MNEILFSQRLPILALRGLNVFPGMTVHFDVGRKKSVRAVEEAMRAIVQRCLEKGVVVGTFADTVEAAHKWRAMGVKYLSYSVDVGIFYDAVKALKQQIMP